MANGREENLIPFDQRTEEEHRRIASMGGKASGAARRRKRSLREAADYYLSLPAKDRRTVNALVKKGLEEEEIDNQMVVVASMTSMASKGDTKAAKLIFDLMADEPGDVADQSGVSSFLAASSPSAADVEELFSDG